MKNVKVQKIFQAIVGFSVSGILLVMVFRKISFSEVLIATKQVNPVALSLSVVLFGLGCLLRALMWRVTTKPLGSAKISILFGGVVIGYMANNLLPLRVGEILRAHYFTVKIGAPLASSLSTIFIERVCDVMALGLLLVVALIFRTPGIAFAKAGVLFSIFIFICMMALAGTFMLCHTRKNITRFKPLVAKLVEFGRPIAQLRDLKNASMLGILALAAWFINYLSMLVLVQPVANQPLEAALLLLLFVNLGLLIPSSPGAFGVMQAAFLLALDPFGVLKEQSLALSFAYQTGLYFFTLAVGLPYFLVAKLTFDKRFWL